MDKLRKELGIKVRRLRRIKGYTQERLGEKCGISYKFIGEIERGTVNPSLDSLVSIADALNVKIQNLFPGEGDLIGQFSATDLSTIRTAAKLLHNRLNLKR